MSDIETKDRSSHEFDSNESVCSSGSGADDQYTDIESSSEEATPHGPTTGVTTILSNGSGQILCNLSSVTTNHEHQCWVCFASEEDDPTADWTHPCLCSGTTKWVHQSCIQRWIDEKQRGNVTAPVSCPQCGTTYKIQFPQTAFLVKCLDSIDSLVKRLCPMLAGGLCVGSLYWTCVTYGAVCVMQCVGHVRGLKLMEKSDPLLLLVALPLVPVGLVLGNMVRWEEPVLEFLRCVVPKLPPMAYLMPVFADSSLNRVPSETTPALSDTVSVTRSFCSALLLPAVASIVGATLFGSVVTGTLRRTLAGGLTFIVIKGMFNVYHKQHIFVRRNHRLILDYDCDTTLGSTSNNNNDVYGGETEDNI